MCPPADTPRPTLTRFFFVFFAVTKNKARVEAIKAELDARKAGRGASSGQQALKNKLAELRGQFQTVLKRKQHLRGQLEAASKTRDAVRASLKELKANMKFTTVEAIDEQIAKLEHRVQHSTLSLNEEKAILDDIRKLKNSRTEVGKFSEKLETLAQDDTTRGELTAEIKLLDEELNKIKAEEEVLRGELASLREKEAEKGSDVPAMLAEREECREVCKQAYEKIKDLRAEHDAVWQEFKAQDKIWKAQQAEERAKRREEMAAERAARDAARAARLAEMAPEPFDKEITMCEQLIAYVNRFIAAQSGPATAAEDKSTTVAEMDGMKVFARKADEQDAFFGGTGSKKGKKAAKKPAAAAAGPAKIAHSLDMLEAFATLSISVPTSAAAMTATLGEVEAKKTEYLGKREEAKAAKEKAAAEGADAAEGASADVNGDGEEVEEGEIVQEASSSDAGAAAAKGGKKGKKGAAPPPPKLDDAESWPSMGGEAAPAPAVDPSKPSAADVAKGVASAGGVAVGLKVADGSVSLSISHDDEE